MIPTPSISPTTMEVQIPVNLAAYAMAETDVNGSWCCVRNEGNKTHPLMKPIGLYLLLKAESPESGWILDYAKQIPGLALAFGISRRSFYNYLSKLESMKLAFRMGTKLRLVGWKELGRVLEINTEEKSTIQYKLYGKNKLHLWFAAIEIEANQELQAKELWRKLNTNSTIMHHLLSALCKRGYKYADRNDRDQFISALFMLYVQDFATGTEVHDYLIDLRSDLNRTIRSIAAAWDASPSMVSYYKKQMQEHGIINVSKLAIMSEWRHDTRECHKNKNCHVIWNEAVKERVWFLCDQISVLRPWEWQAFLKQNLAA